MTPAAKISCGLLGLFLGFTALAPAQDPDKPPAADAVAASSAAVEFNPTDWQYVAELPVPAAQGEHYDFLATPELFDGARYDLADVRIRNAAGAAVPYGLRIRVPVEVQEKVAANIFNRGVTPEGEAELSLDLGERTFDYNEVQVNTAGTNFRRRATLEGSADEKTWNKLDETNLLRFGNYQRDTFNFPTSRFRYLRVRVAKDPVVDTEPVSISDATISRKFTRPGEFVTREAKLGPREAGQRIGAFGSLWIIDLGGENVPCERLDIDVADPEFAREYSVEGLVEDRFERDPYRYRPATNYPPGDYYDDNFRHDPSGFDDLSGMRAVYGGSLTNGSWQRRIRDKREPMEAKLGSVRAGKLRLFVADHSNPPLTITSVKYTAPAVQLIVPAKAVGAGPLKVYFGNPSAMPPEYDFGRNLPEVIEPAPTRLALGARAENPDYVPPPLPFTERWAWLIHTALGATCLVLAGLIAMLSRQVIARHDEQEAAESAQPAAVA